VAECGRGTTLGGSRESESTAKRKSGDKDGRMQETKMAIKEYEEGTTIQTSLTHSEKALPRLCILSIQLKGKSWLRRSNSIQL
jgi:hypothetical protein